MFEHFESFCDTKAYDQHLNMVLGDAEEVFTSVEIDDETAQESIKVVLVHFLNSSFPQFFSLLIVVAIKTDDSDAVCSWRWCHSDLPSCPWLLKMQEEYLEMS